MWYLYRGRITIIIIVIISIVVIIIITNIKQLKFVPTIYDHKVFQVIQDDFPDVSQFKNFGWNAMAPSKRREALVFSQVNLPRTYMPTEIM